MARFLKVLHPSKFSIQARPTDWRRLTPFQYWTFPYNTGSPLPFELEVTDVPYELNIVFLSQLDLYIRTRQDEVREFPHFENIQAFKAEYRFSVQGEENFELWSGKPDAPGSRMLIFADQVNPTTIIWSLISVIFGAILGWLL
ncbi:MAG: hypothetical protein KIT46_04565 [Anaerolineales bacterium]|nr:hypothetical protein [Anaerolineales bacterium]MCW5855303.1 hypothetical protein [Anaerolineales bacterium]